MRPELDRTFAALVFDWDGTAVPDRRARTPRLRRVLEQLVGLGVEVVIVSGTHVDNVDRQLRARPAGPGALHLCLNRGSEVFAVGPSGPRLVHRRTATAEEDRALDEAAGALVQRLADVGLRATIVSNRLNRRKIDLLPEPAWVDPPKSQIGALVTAVQQRLGEHGLGGLSAVVSMAVAAGVAAGLRDPRVTTDAKHVEIGLTDKSDSMGWALEHLASRGVTGGLVLVGGDEFGALGGVGGSDALLLVPGTERALAVSVGVEPNGVPKGVLALGGGPKRFVELLADQLTRHRSGRVPAVDRDPAWTVSRAAHPLQRRTTATLLTLCDGRFGTRGSAEERAVESGVLSLGLYDGDGDQQHLMPGPVWNALDAPRAVASDDVQTLDLRTGVLVRTWRAAQGEVRSLRFSSLARPGVMALAVEGPAGVDPGPPLRAPEGGNALLGRSGEVSWARALSAAGGGCVAAAVQRSTVSRSSAVPCRFERLAAYVADSSRAPSSARAVHRIRSVEEVGLSRLLVEHRAAWAKHWADADVAIEGDPESQLAVRFALFHLLGSAAGGEEAAVGARGLSGSGYSGHVFWDADVFVLPTLAAVHPAAARAMLGYRVRRLSAAQDRARAEGRAGARFPWESARDGTDVTPRSADVEGQQVPIHTGQREEHIVADVAWAAAHYVDWAGDGAFLRGDGRTLITETARYWASRCERDADGRAHVRGVIGPDEYHPQVDDNAYTNVMARWNLRRGAGLLDPSGPEAVAWRELADALVDGYDPRTGRYEQFAGFDLLEPLLIAEVATPPVAADLLLGAPRVAGSQVIKQADVLMLHLLVPGEVAPGSLLPNLAHYDPRTSHGSSLSPAVQAALLARAGRPDEALPWFRLAGRLDLDDLTGTTAAGLHLATLGGLWQALAFGFAGLRVEGEALRVDPKLPSSWEAVTLRLRFRGRRLSLTMTGDEVRVDADRPTPVIGSTGEVVTTSSCRVVRAGEQWVAVPGSGSAR